jgi:hypothetical protein
MYPNTFMMQELFRRNFDQNAEHEDEGKEVETPFIFTIPKGMLVYLLLGHPGADKRIQEHQSRGTLFLLMSSSPSYRFSRHMVYR